MTDARDLALMNDNTASWDLNLLLAGAALGCVSAVALLVGAAVGARAGRSLRALLSMALLSGAALWSAQLCTLAAAYPTVRLLAPEGAGWLAAPAAVGACLLTLIGTRHGAPRGLPAFGLGTLVAAAWSAGPMLTLASSTGASPVVDRPWLAALSGGVGLLTVMVGVRMVGQLREVSGVRETLRYALPPAVALTLTGLTVAHAALLVVRFDAARAGIPQLDVPPGAAAVAGAMVFLALTAALAQAHTDRRDAERFYGLGRLARMVHDVTATPDPRQTVCEAACDFTSMDAAVLLEPDEERGTLNRSASSPLSLRPGPVALSDDEHPAARAFRQVRVELASGVELDGSGAPAVYAPVCRSGRPVGVLAVALPRRAGRLTDEVRALVALLAAEAGVAIEHAGLLGRLQGSARAETRQRLARDLHDSVAQDLVSAMTYAQTTAAAVQVGDSQAADFARIVERQLRQASGEMRVLLNSLRSPDTELFAPSLPEALSAAVLNFEYKSPGVAVHVSRDMPADGAPRPEVTEAVYFVLREALHNVAQHAAAQHVTVTLHVSEQRLRLAVADDGKGFDSCAKHDRRFGLMGMRERAEQLDGSVELTSAAREGSTVVLRLPAPLAASAPSPVNLPQ